MAGDDDFYEDDTSNDVLHDVSGAEVINFLNVIGKAHLTMKRTDRHPSPRPHPLPILPLPIVIRDIGLGYSTKTEVSNPYKQLPQALQTQEQGKLALLYVHWRAITYTQQRTQQESLRASAGGASCTLDPFGCGKHFLEMEGRPAGDETGEVGSDRVMAMLMGVSARNLLRQFRNRCVREYSALRHLLVRCYHCRRRSRTHSH